MKKAKEAWKIAFSDLSLTDELKDKYKIPSFEEFMKDYKHDSNLDYKDLDSISIDKAKGYVLVTE